MSATSADRRADRQGLGREIMIWAARIVVIAALVALWGRNPHEAGLDIGYWIIIALVVFQYLIQLGHEHGADFARWRDRRRHPGAR